MAKITISRLKGCTRRDMNDKFTDNIIRLCITDDDRNILVEGEMTLEEYARLISGESEVHLAVTDLMRIPDNESNA